MKNRILYLCTAHQNTEQKVNHVLRLLKGLSVHGVDVCFVSHVPNGLDKIAESCQFVSYDNDNGPVTVSYAAENLDKFPEHNLSKFRIFRSMSLGEATLTVHTGFIEYHTKPALSLMRSGIVAAKNFGYEWVVYMEYDTVLPPDGFDLKGHFERLASRLDGEGKEGLFYTCEGKDDFRNGTVWPFMFLCRTSVFLRDRDFMSQWQRSPGEFFRRFGNLSYEEILEKIAGRNNTVEFRNAFKIKEDMNYNFEHLTELSIFGAGKNDGTRMWEINKILEFELVSVKRDDGLFDLNIFRTTYLRERMDESLASVVSVTIDAWLEGIKIFTHTDFDRFRKDGFEVWGLIHDITPKSDNRKVRFKATIDLGDTQSIYCDYSVSLYSVDDYFKFMKGLEITSN